MNIKMFRVGVLVIGIALISLGTSSWAYAGERKVNHVPDVVENGFKKAYPQAVILSYEEEVKNGKTTYEIESKDGSTRRDVILSSTGQILEAEEKIKKTEIPQAVQEAIRSKYPEAEITRAEKVNAKGKIQYEVGLKQGKKRFSIEFDSNGEYLKKD